MEEQTPATIQHDLNESPAASLPDAPPPVVDFEDLTLSEAIGRLVNRPIATLAALFAVARVPSGAVYYAEPPSVFASERPRLSVPVLSIPSAAPPAAVPLVMMSADGTELTPAQRLSEELLVTDPVPVAVEQREEPPRGIVLVRFVLRLVAFITAWFGSTMLADSTNRINAGWEERGTFFFAAAIVIWLVGDALPVLSRMIRRVPRSEAYPGDVPPFRCDDPRVTEMTAGRMFAGLVMILGAVGAYSFNHNNLFSPEGVLAWFTSILAALWFFAPAGWVPQHTVRDALEKIRAFRIRITPVVVALLVIMGVGTYFRLYDLANTPSEMTSDHVEKLLDAQNVREGVTNVFFANNGGRDAIQFFFLAGLGSLPGVEMNFTLLKVATVIEGLLTIPVMFWLGRELIGNRDKRLGIIVGILLAAFVAVSSWHVILSRLGLRIVLTPLFTALVVGFFVRGLRTNRRWDFLYTGLALGVSLYAYQATRMLPFIIVLGVPFALIIGAKTGRVRWALIVNMMSLVAVSALIFLPLFRYSVENPQEFWRRMSGRVLGDEMIQATDENGNLVARQPTVPEQLEAFAKTVPNILENTRNAFRMYHVNGDSTWLHNSPGKPALDPIAGALLILGLAAWFGRSLFRRDPANWWLIPSIVLMMVPSISALAFPAENPSATRMSGTLPGIYLLVAVPLALVVVDLHRLAGRMGTIVAAFGAIILIGLSYSANNYNVFVNYHDSYVLSAQSYSTGGDQLRSFAAGDQQGYGNAYILSYPYWWDHRAVGISGGAIKWDNTILTSQEIPTSLRNSLLRRPNGVFPLDPNLDLFFLVSPDDAEGLAWLISHFPTGLTTSHESTNGRSFLTYRVPAVGWEAINMILKDAGLEEVAPN